MMETVAKKQNQSQSHTLSVVVKHNLNAICRVIGVFSGCGFEVDSVSFGNSNTSNVSRITITTRGDDQIIEQIIKQLHKIIDVVKVNDLTYEKFVDRELALIKVAANQANRSEVMQVAQVFKAKVIDISPNKISLEVTGNSDKIDAFVSMLNPFGIAEIARTGSVALKREYNGST